MAGGEHQPAQLCVDGDLGGRRRTCARVLPNVANQREITVKGCPTTFQENSPREIGEALRELVLGMRI